MVALKRYPKRERRAVAQRWGRLGNEAQQRIRNERGPDADTMRKRALHDARGELVSDGASYINGKERSWQITRSFSGRTDQFDVVINGSLRDTCGRRKLCSTYGVRTL